MRAWVAIGNTWSGVSCYLGKHQLKGYDQMKIKLVERADDCVWRHITCGSQVGRPLRQAAKMLTSSFCHLFN